MHCLVDTEQVRKNLQERNEVFKRLQLLCETETFKTLKETEKNQIQNWLEDGKNECKNIESIMERYEKGETNNMEMIKGIYWD